MRCTICGDPNLIYSGADAFLFGVPTEVYCMSCVRKFPQLSRAKVDQVAANDRAAAPPL